jgi:hypothetical protein
MESAASWGQSATRWETWYGCEERLSCYLFYVKSGLRESLVAGEWIGPFPVMEPPWAGLLRRGMRKPPSP